MLEQRLDCRVTIRTVAPYDGRMRYEATITSEDGQTLYIHEGQLKEAPVDRLEPGKSYRLTFRPFINNRWIELKIVDVREEE